MSQPDGNKTSTTKEAAGALATVSTAVDPMPHFVLAGASLGSGAYYLYRKPPMTTLGWGLAAAGLAYGYAGYLLGSTDRQQQRLGYDISTVASIGLVAVTGPTVYNKGLFADILQSGLATVGAVSTVGNANKAWVFRGAFRQRCGTDSSHPQLSNAHRTAQGAPSQAHVKESDSRLLLRIF